MDLFEELDRTNVGRAIMDRIEQEARRRDGVARIAYWSAEDGWVIAYTTARVQGGPHDGRFVTQAFKPVGKGARSGNASELHQVYRRAFSTRKAAKARAEQLYRQHSPKYAAAVAEREGRK